MSEPDHTDLIRRANYCIGDHPEDRRLFGAENAKVGEKRLPKALTGPENDHGPATVDGGAGVERGTSSADEPAQTEGKK